MHSISPSWTKLLPIAVFTSLLAPAAADAASYRFKVNLSVVQTTDWAQTVRHPAPGSGYCGTRDVHWEYRGEGDGQLKAKIVGARVTFTGTRRVLQSSEIKIPGSVVSDHTPYTVSRVGNPDPGCDLPAPPPPPHAGEVCGQLVRRPGTARSFLLVMRGRLNLTGGFYRRDGKACADPSLYTGVLGFGGRPKRNDVNRLIVNKRVRSIELSSADNTVFGVKHLSSFGANSETLEGSGTGSAHWKVKLTRIR